MDNLTHSLAGLVTAEIVVQLRRRRGGEVDVRWSRAAWIVSAAAHNVPDIDFVYTWITEGKLGYLLHHRGHTHTLALAPLMALLPFALAWLWARRRGWSWSRADAAWLLALAVLGPIGHLLLDLSNSYGVHPFWPISSRWIAGDTIFIVEPLFWAVTIPAILLATRARWGRIAWGVALALGLMAPWIAPFVVWPFALAATLLGAAMLAISQRVRDGARVGLALGASVVVLAVFAASGAAAEARVRRVLGSRDREAEIVEVVRSPIPATPACWEMIVVERTGDRHAVRIVRVSAWAPWVPVEDCSGAARAETTAPLEHEGWRRDGVWIEAELEASTAELRALAQRC
ncbi:MAG: metal-dependent hydrolase, partial [Myxococcota bacterium]|nr:metal-dependent hydrolase [Myxococcota bacterium]